MDTKEGNVGCISRMLHITAQSQPQEKCLRDARSQNGREIRKGNQKLNGKERKDKAREVRMKSLNLIQEEAN